MAPELEMKFTCKPFFENIERKSEILKDVHEGQIVFQEQSKRLFYVLSETRDLFVCASKHFPQKRPQRPAERVKV